VLLATPLLGVDGEVFALAQGALSIGGFAGSTDSGDSVQQNHPTVGRIPRGALVERELVNTLRDRPTFSLILHEKDFTTAARMADAVNRRVAGSAHAADAGTVVVSIPESQRANPVPFLALIQELDVTPGRSATVVLNERTGTVVIGSEVSIAAVAITHGNLSIRVGTRTEVSQPAPFAKAGDTVVFDNAEIVIQEEGSSLVLVQGVTIGELVRALNSTGATPRDLIAILQAVKAAGALQAELKII
jgi:flagellar P-ring protein precursor FlgI